ncbi:MAG: hydroxyacylglutathione hydrolase, partial [Pseudomonadota bacterium]
MTFDLVTIPCRTDNYAFLVVDRTSSKAALIDAPEAGPIQSVLDQSGLLLTDILITHHHDDHISAVEELALPTTRIVGARADAHRLPKLDLAVTEGETFTLFGVDVDVIDVPGHTVGHVAYYIEDVGALFTGDSLMALGCGRLFEGTAQQMWESLTKLMAYPSDTKVCSGHEYTASN